MGSLPPAVLVMEALVALLVVPSVAQSNDNVALGASLAAALAVCLLLTATRAKRRNGIIVGTVLQIPLVLSGLLAWPMWILGVLFTGLWAAAVQSARQVQTPQRPPAEPPQPTGAPR